MVRGMSAYGVRPCPVDRPMCISEKEISAPGGILLSAYMCTTILIIIILLLCVLVWFMAYLWVIYSKGIDMNIVN